MMESLLGPLLPLFDRERMAGRAVALGVLLHTIGSTYRKPGALMLIASNGDYAGMLSGGCLEGDLRERARAVIETGQARLVSYDMRGSEDLMWGLGLGCEGAMRILLLRVAPQSHWEPLNHLACQLAQDRPTAVGIVVESERDDLPVGALTLYGASADEPVGRALREEVLRWPAQAPLQVLERAARTGSVGWFEAPAPRWKLFALPLSLPPRLLLLGGGPDAAPIVELATRVHWKVTVLDHRPAYAVSAHFPAAERVLLARADELGRHDLPHYAAAIVMSHHLPSDLSYLRALAATAIAYIGLLGPAARRERLLSDLGTQDAEKLRSRLHAPVGLPLGGRTPEAIALAIVAELHAFVHGTLGQVQAALEHRAERA
ncbi:MAG TPA: XdhC family protein [Steroidobacteraceae bacterium]